MGNQTETRYEHGEETHPASSVLPKERESVMKRLTGLDKLRERANDINKLNNRMRNLEAKYHSRFFEMNPSLAERELCKAYAFGWKDAVRSIWQSISTGVFKSYLDALIYQGAIDSLDIRRAAQKEMPYASVPSPKQNVSRQRKRHQRDCQTPKPRKVQHDAASRKRLHRKNR